MPKYAILSVYDKTGIVQFAKSLIDSGYLIISSGGTAKELSDSGIKVTPVEVITKNPEALDGRIKTISYQIEGGILFDRSNPEHVKEADKLGLPNIEIVACNLYPFEEKNSIENIDVGGPTMLRSAAKNYQSVLVISDPNDYEMVTEFIKSSQSHPRKLDSRLRGNDIRTELAAKTFEHLSFYDSQIARFLRTQTDTLFPKEITLGGKKVKDLRYGENPHQTAALYLIPGSKTPFAKIEHIAGRELSMMNVTDINAGLEAVRVFDESAAVVIKHNTPCGIALGDSPAQALQRAINADPESAFGGVVVVNKPFDKSAAQIVTSFKDERKGLFDIVAAPGIDEDAKAILKGVRKSMGVYVLGPVEKPKKDGKSIKEVLGGFVYQTSDGDIEGNRKNWTVVTEKKPTEVQLKQMELAWKFIRRMRSNTVIIMHKTLPQTTGIGTGQTSRYRAAQMAIDLAGPENSKGAIMASDAFFPFDDVVSLAGKHKIGAIIQSGGSINDQSSIDAANKASIPMVFTNERTFWHY